MKNSIRIAIVGYGSIGKRHINNICNILGEKEQSFTLDVFRHSNGGAEVTKEDKLRVDNFYNIQELEENGIVYDIVFITNPTICHYDTIMKFSSYARNMFIEKPVFADTSCDVDVLMDTIDPNGVYYVACPLRYTAVFDYIKNNINIEDVYSARAICSSYLPEWRPNVDYRMTYSAHRDMGGGVAIDLIHEWDYICCLFGRPEQVMYLGGKFSDLEMDCDDLATYIGLYKDKCVEVHLDYFGRDTIRELMLLMKDETVIADFTNNCIRMLKSNKEIVFREERDDYQRKEIKHFLDIVEGKCKNDSTILEAYNLLKIAKGENR